MARLRGMQPTAALSCFWALGCVCLTRHMALNPTVVSLPIRFSSIASHAVIRTIVLQDYTKLLQDLVTAHPDAGNPPNFAYGAEEGGTIRCTVQLGFGSQWMLSGAYKCVSIVL